AVYYVLEFMSGRGSGIAAALNELVYLVLGLPLMVIAAGYLPVSIYLSFFSRGSTDAITIGLFVGVGVLEVLSISYLIVRHLRDKNMNLIQYLKYLFDFERRSEEVKKVKDRRDQIDSFYDDLHKVEQKIATKLEEKSSGFDQFDWRERVGQIGTKTIQSKKCWSCQATNDDDALFCENCQAPLEDKG
ncbi:MAG: zinc ribbon domain-containing protein, partial [Candidatus Heimdallarchaeota archaeon]|nr:zinc ribbon domain-containing protein [Candidatus Heimdallarchaeota archaeon]